MERERILDCAIIKSDRCARSTSHCIDGEQRWCEVCSTHVMVPCAEGASDFGLEKVDPVGENGPVAATA